VKFRREGEKVQHWITASNTNPQTVTKIPVNIHY